ncbi:hypothetical protein ACQGFJ_00035 [Rhodococcus sp. 3.70]
MTTIASSGSSGKTPRQEPPGLPVRWVVIAILAAVAGVFAFLAGGVVPAITAACAVATAGHKIIAS